ncbi:MAG: phage protease [Burkholderiales bacterium]
MFAHGKMRSMHRASPLAATALAACNSSAIGMLTACTFELQSAVATRELRLLPAGEFRSLDGRPQGVKSWRLDGALARRIIDSVAALNQKKVIDYEHQTLFSEKNGQPAPASGWFKQLEWREGAGLFATDVEWTARAKKHIEDGEYKYLSPVFDFDPKTGEVIRLRHAALTNDPGLDGLGEVLALAAARFNAQLSQETSTMNPLLKSQQVHLKPCIVGNVQAEEWATVAVHLCGGISALCKAFHKADNRTQMATAVNAYSRTGNRH